MKKKPLVSIVIPTCNRYKYLKGCLEATLSIPSDQLEIIVHDNTEDNSSFLEYIDGITDERLRYYHLKEYVNVSDNCSYGIEKAHGRFVCLIGDDDTVCSNIVELAACMEKREIDTCVFGISKYNWPDLLELVPTLNCFESPTTCGNITTRDTSALLHKALKTGIQSISDLPRVYHAISSKYVLDQIKEKAGTYFPGPSPDMANAMGCLLYSRKHIQTDIPVMISGYGGNSTGGLGRRKKHKGSLKDKPWLPQNIDEIWDSKIPRLWMGNTIWPVSAILALKALGANEYLNEVDYSIISAETFLHDPSSVKEIRLCRLSLLEYCRMVGRIINRIVKKYLNSDKSNKDFAYVSLEPMSLLDAKNIQENYNSNFSFERVFDSVSSNE